MLRAFSVVVFALLAGCAASGSSIGTLPVSKAMTGTTSATDLLYVSDAGTGTVRMYSLPTGKGAGMLKHLNQPTGVCSDSLGNIWVVESGTSYLREYAHGMTKPIKVLKAIRGKNLWGCSVDLASGNLAVAVLGGPKGGGALWVYSGSGIATKYTASNLQAAFFCGYDSNGNLFVDGIDASGSFQLFELPQGSGTLASITLNQSVGFPGGIAWDGQYVTVGDQFYNNQNKSAIYQISVAGSIGTVEGTTTLDDSCDVGQFTFSTVAARKRASQPSTVIAPDECQNNVRFYNYPAGGKFTKKLTGLQLPIAAALSVGS